MTYDFYPRILLKPLMIFKQFNLLCNEPKANYKVDYDSQMYHRGMYF